MIADPEHPPWQARVRRSPGGRPQGGGVLCTDRWVLTCAHVVSDGADPPDGVWVEFPFAGSGLVPARVSPDGWHPDTGAGFADLALLELVGEIPAAAESAPLRIPAAQVAHGFRVFGFPKGHDQGVTVRGEVEGPAHGEWTQLVADIGRGHVIDRGFSGSPVWDEQLAAVTGIVVSRDLNPSVRGGYSIGMDVAARYLPQLRDWVGWRVSADADFSGYWDPRARGVDRATRRGSYFTGRRAARRELVAWAGDAALSGIRVVTGSPGSGKSALIAHMLMLSDPWMRSPLRAQHGLMADEAASVPAGWASVGVRATGLDRDGLAAKLASGLSVRAADPDGLLAALVERGQRSRVTIVVDGLDEAMSPIEADRIARALLLPLAADAGIAVLVGTRRGHDGRLVRAFGPRAVVIDLDDPAFLELDDLVSYAAASLRLDHDPASVSPYRNDPAAAAAVARAIASAANPSFLVAGLAARARAEDLEVIDTTIPGWQAGQHFPADVEAAMEGYLQHVPNWELLVPVAYARPPGLPRDTLWAALAAGYAGRPVGIADLDALRRSAAAYLIETTADRQEPAVSLFHQALTDYVRSQAREPAVDAAFTEVLTARVNEAGGWAHADDYTRRHLATHAAAAGRLDDLIVDPGFLLATEAKPLMSALRSLATQDGRRAGAAYRLAHHRLHRARPADRRSYMELAARRIGATVLADRTHALPGVVAWQPVWATRRRRPGTILTRHPHSAFAVAVGDVDGNAVAVSGGPDGLVRATELATSTALGTEVAQDGVAVMARPEDPVAAVAVSQFGGAAHAIASFSSGAIWATDLSTGSETIEIVAAHQLPEPGRGQWTLLASTEHHPLLATCEMDEVIRIWDLEVGRPVAEPRHPGGAVRLAAGEIDGSPVLVSGGFDGSVRIWDFTTGKRRGKTYRAGSGQVHTLGTTGLDGHLVVLASVLGKVNTEGYGRPGIVRAWDVQTGRSVAHLTKAKLKPGRLGAATISGRPVIALASHAELSIIDGRSAARLVPDFFTDGFTINLALADVDGRLGVITGQDTGVVELIMADEIGGSAGATDSGVQTVRGGRVAEGARVIVGGIEGERIRLWDLSGDSAPRVPSAAQERANYCFDIAQAGGRTVAVAGSYNPDRILAWDAETGQPLADLKATDAARAVTVALAEGRTIIVGIGEHVRVWDLATGPLWQAELPSQDAYLGPSPHPLIYSSHGLSAVLWWDASGCRAWDLFTGERLAATPRHQGLSAAAIGTIGQQTVGILGTDNGSIPIWDLRTGKRPYPPLKCGGRVSAFAIRAEAGEATLYAATGGGVREWNLTRGHLVRETLQGEWASAAAVIRVGNECMPCIGLQNGQVHLPIFNLTLELDEPVGDIWSVSGDRIVVSTNKGIVAIKVNQRR